MVAPLVIPLAIGGLSMLSSMAADSDANAQMESKAAAFGVRKAGIMASKDAMLNTLVSDKAKLADQVAQAGIDIEKSQAQAEAQARVNAAAAGTAGASVDVTIAEADVNAANAKSQVNQKQKAGNDQIRLNFVNSVINAETQVGTLDTSSRASSARTLMSGATGFLGAL